LIRHVWTLNVNESLAIEANCNIGNIATNELGIDMTIKNMNQVHHPLMSEIVINDVQLFCASYNLNADRVLCKRSLR
jgi:trafficking protein particle complex subunit 8